MVLTFRFLEPGVCNKESSPSIVPTVLFFIIEIARKRGVSLCESLDSQGCLSWVLLFCVYQFLVGRLRRFFRRNPNGAALASNLIL